MMMYKFLLETVGLLETKMRKKQDKIWKSFDRGCGKKNVRDSIWILWNPRIWNVEILLIHKQLIRLLY